MRRLLPASIESENLKSKISLQIIDEVPMEAKQTKGSVGPEQDSYEKRRSPYTSMRMVLKPFLKLLDLIGGFIRKRLSTVSQYLLIGALILIAGIFSWQSSQIIPPAPPDLFTDALSLSWWIKPVERAPIVRLPIIATELDPVRYSLTERGLYLAFQGELSEAQNFAFFSRDGKVIRSIGGAPEQTTIEKKDDFQWRHRYFFTSPELIVKPTRRLDEIVRLASKYQEYEIVLIGTPGADFRNQKIDPEEIGRKLAAAMREWLISQGVDPEWIKIADPDPEFRTTNKSSIVDISFKERVSGNTIPEGNVQLNNESNTLEWNTIPDGNESYRNSTIIKLDETWALSKDKGVVLRKADRKPWLPVSLFKKENPRLCVAITKKFAASYLKRTEPAYEFRILDGGIQWRKKIATEGENEQSKSTALESSPKWNKANFHRSYPAPIAYVLIGIIGLVVLGIAAGKAPVSTAASGKGIVEHFASDAPIKRAIYDCLGFNQIARSISQFLRNEKTEPPLTIAITGQWGCGKTSLMQLLASDLRRHYIRPVWLNAWHHQNESQFLYGLLNAIRSQGIPSILSMSNVLFRARLLASRLKEKPLYIVILAGAIAAPAGFFIAVERSAISGNLLADWLSKTPWAFMAASILPCILGISSLSREKLTKLATTKLKQHVLSLTSAEVDLRSSAGLREQFIKEFGHFCTGLGVSTLTVFIDDLDRCNEKRIMDVLETVNFLVSSGKCVVIFGMDREPVERSVAEYYRGSNKEFDKNELSKFSQRYLEKLVNIEVPVPTAKGEDTANLVATERKRRFNWRMLFKPIVFILVVALISWACLKVGSKIGNYYQEYTMKTEAVELTTEKFVIASKSGEEKGSKQRSLGEINVYRERDAGRVQYSYAIGILAIIVLFAAVLTFENYRQKKRTGVSDTTKFSNTLDKWMLLMGYRKSTPRAIKRFVNRSRFLAMRLSNDKSSDIDEADLVTMAGLHELDPKLIDLMELGDNLSVGQKLNDYIADEKLEDMKQAITQCDGFNDPEMVAVFKSWVQGFEVR